MIAEDFIKRTPGNRRPPGVCHRVQNQDRSNRAVDPSPHILPDRGIAMALPRFGFEMDVAQAQERRLKK
jgi:hypothetical protein